MKTSHVCATGVMVAAIMLAAILPAHGYHFRAHCSTLDQLIEHADAIAIVDVLTQESVSPFIGPEDYRVRVVHILKGELAKGDQLMVSLFWTALPRPADRQAEWVESGFRVAARYLVFLRPGGRNSVKSSYSNLDDAGAQIEIPRGVPLTVLKAGTTKGMLANLLKSSLELKRKELQTLENKVETILKDETRIQ